MSHDAWSGITLTSVLANGNLQQLYPTFVTPGVVKSTSTIGQLILRPMQGALHSIQARPDGQNGGTIEIWDLDGGDVGADVSSSITPVITDAQLVTLQSLGLAKLIYQEDFAGAVGSGLMNAAGMYRPFVRGLAARFIMSGSLPNPLGTVGLNLVVEGGFFKTESRGSY